METVVVHSLVEDRLGSFSTKWGWRAMTSLVRCSSLVVSFHVKMGLIVPFAAFRESGIHLEVAAPRSNMILAIVDFAVSDAIREGGA